jgi:hypothetical protein
MFSSQCPVLSFSKSMDRVGERGEGGRERKGEREKGREIGREREVEREKVQRDRLKELK